LSIQLRNYLSDGISEAPQVFLCDHPTVSSIISYFHQNDNSSLKENEKSNLDSNKKFDYKATTHLLNSHLNRASRELVKAGITNYLSPDDVKKHVVLLTGATGSPWCFYFCESSFVNPNVKKVYALVPEKKGADLMGRIV
jgi:hypothetical protein